MPASLPNGVNEFLQSHNRFFFSYVCYRKEFALEFLAETIRRFRKIHPNVGFLWLGPWEREMAPMKEFLRAEKIEGAIFLLGSVPHETFLTILSRSLAYIRTPITDGVCSSVLESLKLKIPVLASENGTRPIGTELWKAGDVDSLLRLMKDAVDNHGEFVARIPEITLEDNAKRLADDIETICRRDTVSAPPTSKGPDRNWKLTETCSDG